MARQIAQGRDRTAHQLNQLVRVVGAPVQEQEPIAVLVRDSPEQAGGSVMDQALLGGEPALVTAARGEWPGGYRPYAYELDHATGRLVSVDAESRVPPLIFDLYVRERLGARGVANVLNERGYRTKAGTPWSTDAVLTVLRNRVYLGEIYFRGTWYRADQHHPGLVDADLFEQAHQILIAVGMTTPNAHRRTPSTHWPG